MILTLGKYVFEFTDGGILVKKDGELLYFNKRPIYVSVKTYGAINEFRDVSYENICEKDGVIYANGIFSTDNGSVIFVEDVYTVIENNLKIERKAVVEKADENDLGFQTKIFFYQAKSDNLRDFYYFSPGQWYRQNEFAGDYAIGKNLDLSYHYRKETYSGLPMFSMQNIKTGETISMSRWEANATLPMLDRTTTENYAYVDSKITVGSFGVSKATPEALTYTYYGHMIKTPLKNTQCDGVAIDYIYPGVNGQTPAGKRGPFNVDTPIKNITWVHPIKVGFEQNYAVAVTLNKYETYNDMLRETWREVYVRLKDELFEVDNEALFNNTMKFFTKITKNFGTAYGTPFVAQLPDFDPNSFSAEIGFVGQQTGIGYQLLRYGVMNNDEEATEKGLGIINYWVNETMTETGCPKVWLHLSTHQFEPQPQWIREIGDGLEAILDAYVFEKKRGIEHKAWLEYCISTANWLMEKQNEDGSLYRSYYYDGTRCMDSKASTPCIVRFLIMMYLVTKNEDYLNGAIKAGQWSYDNMYLGFEYRGGTCDQSDVLDKESGIYCMFAFMALYDVTNEKKWLKAACGAADYVETYTYVWNFPVSMPYPCHPFSKNHITGQSNVTCGSGGGDIYMSACTYSYYRLYLMTGDDHYRDFAEFTNLNCKQANDVDGSFGYKYPGIVNEGGGFSEQIYTGRYHWLPWCNFVQVDPASRFFDTFGYHEVADIEKLPLEERLKKNRIYDNYYPF